MSEMKPGATQPVGAINPAGPNPLQKYFRQPKIYMNLPSKGHWYPEGAIDMPEGNEVPVYAMTAKDELAFKTPDALLNGQSVVDVIQSCVPAIKDGWSTPSIDVDAILIAIRIATYGEKMEIETKVPGSGTDRKFDLDLRQLLDKYQGIEYDNNVDVKDMKIKLRPQDYRQFTRTAMKTFEEQRIATVVSDSEISDEEKMTRFAQSFNTLTNITVDMVVTGIQSIQVGEEVVVDQKHIGEFIKNADKDFFSAITSHMESEKKKFDIEPFKVETTADERQAGAPESYDVPITFDQSNFFG